ncbi:MAG TPA: PilZ domain-containing protein [Thermoanaerobaculia bacterium]|nr:PilZ domain-containing protein [Thermoanaerobaculia bacterium]
MAEGEFVAEPVLREEQRRSPRSSVRIPVALRHEGERFKGTTLVVNRHGALVGAQRNVPMGDIFELENVRNRVFCHCRVVYQGGLGSDGFFRIGVEMLEAHPAVWGADYILGSPAAS